MSTKYIIQEQKVKKNRTDVLFQISSRHVAKDINHENKNMVKSILTSATSGPKVYLWLECTVDPYQNPQQFRVAFVYINQS